MVHVSFTNISYHPKLVVWLQIDPEVNESIGSVRDDKNALTWIVAGFEDGDPKKQLVVMAKGEGDIEELKESLKV